LEILRHKLTESNDKHQNEMTELKRTLEAKNLQDREQITQEIRE
jgi:hypothetical protein